MSAKYLMTCTVSQCFLLWKLAEKLNSVKIKLQLNIDPTILAVSAIFNFHYIFKIYNMYQSTKSITYLQGFYILNHFVF